MGGRGSGPPKGNLNSARNVLPALRRILKGEELPARFNRILSIAEREAQELISDRGGLEHMSGAERLMVANWKSGRQAELLIWAEVVERGGVIQVGKNGSWDLQPGLARLAVFLTAQRQALLALGLERRERPVQDLASYISSFEQKEEKS